MKVGFFYLLVFLSAKIFCQSPDTALLLNLGNLNLIIGKEIYNSLNLYNNETSNEYKIISVYFHEDDSIREYTLYGGSVFHLLTDPPLQYVVHNSQIVYLYACIEDQVIPSTDYLNTLFNTTCDIANEHVIESISWKDYTFRFMKDMLIYPHKDPPIYQYRYKNGIFLSSEEKKEYVHVRNLKPHYID